ncbi:MAG: hypothetical protein JXL97_14395 [Bacteroidales bacterium]|nr:hypothetical protein [Bacteroidales bacterium]
MEIKGTAVKSTQEFVKENYPDRFDEWISSFPETVKTFFNIGILAGNWYPLKEAVIIPTQKAGELFYDGNIKKAAFDIGKDSAIRALKGVYKIFVRIASVDFVLKRIKSIFSTYYSTGKFDMTFRSDNKVVFVATGFTEDEKLIFDRIAGWIEGIFVVISNKPFSVTYTCPEANDNYLSAEFTALWK